MNTPDNSEHVLIKIMPCIDKEERVYNGMIYTYEKRGIKDYVSLYIFDINKKVENVAFYSGQFEKFIASKKIYKHLDLGEEIGDAYCEIEIIDETHNT
jgi:hypothetical protein